MGRYASSIQCVKKVKEHLDVMLENIDHPSFRLRSDNTKKLALQLREAFSYLKKMDHKEYFDRYLKYLPLAEKFMLKERNEFIVVEKRTLVSELVLDSPVIQSKSINEHIAHEPDDIFSVVGYVVEHKNIQEITFARVLAGDIIAPKLQSWCDKNNYDFKWNTKNQLVIFKL